MVEVQHFDRYITGHSSQLAKRRIFLFTTSECPFLNSCSPRSLVFCILLALSFIFSCSDPASKKIEDGSQFPALGKYEGEYWPTAGWKRCAPEEVGMNSDKLMRAYEYAADSRLFTEGILIAKDGYIVGEAYFNGFTILSRHDGYSIAKSFTSALIGIAIDRGLIKSVDEKAAAYLPAWQAAHTPEMKKRITLKHLLTMTGGLAWNNDSTKLDDYLIGAQDDYINYVLNIPALYEPGTRWSYSNGEAIFLSGVIEKATGVKASHFAYDHLFKPIGAVGIYWSSDAAGHTITAWGIHATLRDFARFGYLYLNQGMWDSTQVISKNWIQESTQAISDSMNHYAYLWWLPPGFTDYQRWNIPPKTIIALGANTQRLFVVPEKNLVVVRVGYDSEAADSGWNSMEFLSLILQAVN